MAKAPDYSSIVPKLEKNANDLAAMVNTQAGEQKKKYTEFETIRAGLVEGKKAIMETRKQLADEEATFVKMTKRIDPITSQMLVLSKEAGDLLRDLKDLKKEVDAAEKGVDGSESADKKTLLASLKKIDKTVEGAIDKANELAEEAKSLPDVPKL